MSTTATDSRRDEVVADLVRTLTDTTAPGADPPTDPGLAALRALGTEIWLDNGDLDEAKGLWRQEMSAVTTNNSLANQVVQTGAMDKLVREASRRIRAAEPGVSENDLVLDLVFVVNSHIGVRLAGSLDTRVSVELHPAVAHDVELHPAVAHDIDQTVRYAERYHAVSPDRFIVKLPLTPEGYCAAARIAALYIPTNFTLGFSARQNFLAALLSRPSYVNVFLGRLNAVVAENKLADGKFVGEKAARASQAAVREVRDDDPDAPTRQIAASIRGGDQNARPRGNGRLYRATEGNA